MADYYTKICLALNWPELPQKHLMALNRAVEYFQDGGDLVEIQHFDVDPELALDAEDLEAAQSAARLGTTGCRIEAKHGEFVIQDDDGSASIEPLAAIIQRTIIRHLPEEIVVVQWSNDASKPVTDAYGGGAVVITADDQEFMNTSSWSKGVVERIKASRAAPATP